MTTLRRTSTAIPLIMLALAGATAHAEVKGDAVRIGVLTGMNGIFATAMGPGSVEAAGPSLPLPGCHCMSAQEGRPEVCSRGASLAACGLEADTRPLP